jgi:progesterone-induced-blocking factor 1
LPQVSELQDNLAMYAALEKELDDVVMQAASTDNMDEVLLSFKTHTHTHTYTLTLLCTLFNHQVLISYGYGANVPTTARRRLKQGVALARQLLASQKDNASLKHEVKALKQQLAQTVEQQKATEDLLAKSQQPYNYLIETIRQRDGVIGDLRATVQAMEQDLERTKRSMRELREERDELAADLEQLLQTRRQAVEVCAFVTYLSCLSVPLSLSLFLFLSFACQSVFYLLSLTVHISRRQSMYCTAGTTAQEFVSA